MSKLIKKIESFQLSNGQITYRQQCSYNCTTSMTLTTTTASLSTLKTNYCCNTTNCNQITLPTVVSSCYSFGNYSNSATSVNTEAIPYGTVACVSPKNQYCIYSNGIDMVSGKYISIFGCADSCTNSIYTICCNNSDDCNSPSKMNTL